MTTDVKVNVTDFLEAFNYGVSLNHLAAEAGTDIVLFPLTSGLINKISMKMEERLSPILDGAAKEAWLAILTKIAIFGFLTPSIIYPDEEWKAKTMELMFRQFSPNRGGHDA